jgi:hypothetical protein
MQGDDGGAHAAAHAQAHAQLYLAPPQQPGMLRRATNATRSALGLRARADDQEPSERVVVETDHGLEEYDSDMVDLLDVIGKFSTNHQKC